MHRDMAQLPYEEKKMRTRCCKCGIKYSKKKGKGLTWRDRFENEHWTCDKCVPKLGWRQGK